MSKRTYGFRRDGTYKYLGYGYNPEDAVRRNYQAKSVSELRRVFGWAGRSLVSLMSLYKKVTWDEDAILARENGECWHIEERIRRERERVFREYLEGLSDEEMARVVKALEVIPWKRGACLAELENAERLETFYRKEAERWRSILASQDLNPNE